VPCKLAQTRVSTERGRARSSCYTELRSQISQFKILSVSGTAHLPQLVHEIWIDGEGLPGLCLAGPAGDGFRRLLDPAARLVHVFEASNHITAMQVYHSYLGREPYTLNDTSDREPYPESLKVEQASGEAEWRALHKRWL